MAARDAKRALPAVLLCVGLVVSLVSSLGAPLIPMIARDLGAAAGDAQWSLTAPLLVGAVTTPAIGRLGDSRHRKTTMLVCLAGVTVGGIAAALAGDIWILIAGRALQGLGLAVLPLTMASARAELPAGRSGSLIAALSVTAAVGIGLGYPITGLLATIGGAPAAFWFGTATSALALLLVLLVVPRTEEERMDGGADVPGAIIIAAGLFALLLALEKASEWGWGATATLVLLGAAAVLIPFWVVYELRVAEPLVDLRLMRHRSVLTANASAMIIGIAMYLSIVLVTQYVQMPASAGFGFAQTTFVAGLTLVPLSVASFLGSRSIGAVRERLGTRAIIPIGSIAVAAACLLFGLTGDHLWQAFVMLGIAGLGIGYTFAAMPGLIISAVPPAETGRSMSLYQVSRFVGFAIGSSLSITFLQVLGAGGEPTEGSYRDTFLIGAGVAVVTAVLAWVLPGRALDRPPADARRDLEEGVVGAAGAAMLEDEGAPAAAVPARVRSVRA